MLNIKNYLHPMKLLKKLDDGTEKWRKPDTVFLVTTIFASLALLGLIYYQVRPLNLIDIKVPVSVDKPEYKPGERISGLFFGSVYYEGRVQVIRDVYCENYEGRILTAEGDKIFTGTSIKTKLEGATRVIGNLPEDIPVGKNCVIQFVNVYEIKTPFGTRHEERVYYTQNFYIVKPNGGKVEQRAGDEMSPQLFQPTQPLQSSPSAGDNQTSTPQNNTKTHQNPPNTQNNTSQPAEPVQPPKRCVLNLLGIKLICS